MKWRKGLTTFRFLFLFVCLLTASGIGTFSPPTKASAMERTVSMKKSFQRRFAKKMLTMQAYTTKEISSFGYPELIWCDEKKQEGKTICQMKYHVVKWKSSNQSIVKVLDTGSFCNRKILLQAGKKAGTATIKASAAGMSLTYLVTVKAGKAKARASLAKINQTKKKLTVWVDFINPTDKMKEYGYEFSLERSVEGKWIGMKMKKEYSFTDVAIGVPPKGRVRKKYVLSRYYDLSELPKGTYRLKVAYLKHNDPGNKVVFTI